MPSHYHLNQCCLSVKWTNFSDINLSRNCKLSIQENAFENIICIILVILSRPLAVLNLYVLDKWIIVMTSSNGNIFRVTDHLCGEFTVHRWIPRTKASDAELMFSLIGALNKRLSKQSWGWWFETLSGTLWRHCNDSPVYWDDAYCWNHGKQYVYTA